MIQFVDGRCKNMIFLGGHKKVHKRKSTLAKHPLGMENFSSIHGIKIEDISIKLEDNVGESSINVDTKSNSVLHKSTAVATCGDYHHTVKEEPIELDLSLKLSSFCMFINVFFNF
jgi:hypothetical protein